MTLPERDASALEVRNMVAAGDVTCAEVVAAYLDEATRWQSRLGCLVETFGDDARTVARAADARLARGEPARPLEGVPFTAKANIATKLGETSAGSAMLRGFVAPEDATAVRGMLDAGAILVGKTNCDEFAMGSSCENSALVPPGGPRTTRNPWDVARVPGGSSGGGAALAGATGWAIHLGSDTGGSIRQPAAFCGVTGHKPTYGAVSRSGLVAFGSSLDQVGPFGRTAGDVYAALQAIAGRDGLDSTSKDIELPGDLGSVPTPRRIGVPREYFVDGVTPEIERRTRHVIATLAADGCEVVDVSLPHTRYANACYQVVSTAEASSNLARYDGVRFGPRSESPGDLEALYQGSRGDGFGAEVKRRILLGTFVLSAGYADEYYERALAVRRRIRSDFVRVFEAVDVLICPTSPIAPFRVGERVTDPLALYACDVLTVAANLAGVPATSIPAGLDSDGLPIGVQLIGADGADASVLALADRYQSLCDDHRRLPEVPA